MAGGKRHGEPSLADQIAASGETEVNKATVALREDLTDQRFLGREFLTWLVYFCDDDGESGEFAGSDSVAAFRLRVGERAVLRALGDATGEIAARGPATGHSSDVRYAIAGGLTVRELDLIFERDERLWMATVSAEHFDLKRVKLPELLSEEDSERVSERLQLISDLDAMLKGLFALFLHDRLSSRWTKQTIPALRDWLKRSILEEKYLSA
ncbi:MAG TPA: hypothetical protein PKL17_18510 [Pseudomonadota bacterium]|nr:hypothetical protein [Pseudomonadota bacterium]